MPRHFLHFASNGAFRPRRMSQWGVIALNKWSSMLARIS